MTKSYLLDVLHVIGSCSKPDLKRHLILMESFFSVPSWTDEELDQLLLSLVIDGKISLDR